MRRDRGPLIWFAASVVIASFAFAVYAVHRQQLADRRWQVSNARAETQRQAICAILANIPGQIPPEIENARLAFARPNHPHDCEPLPQATSRPAPTPGRAVRPVVIFPVPAPAQPPGSPSPSRTASPRPTRSPHPSHSPTPSPSPTCSLHQLVTDPTSCLHL